MIFINCLKIVLPDKPFYRFLDFYFVLRLLTGLAIAALMVCTQIRKAVTMPRPAMVSFLKYFKIINR